VRACVDRRTSESEQRRRVRPSAKCASATVRQRVTTCQHHGAQKPRPMPFQTTTTQLSDSYSTEAKPSDVTTYMLRRRSYLCLLQHSRSSLPVELRGRRIRSLWTDIRYSKPRRIENTVSTGGHLCVIIICGTLMRPNLHSRQWRSQWGRGRGKGPKPQSSRQNISIRINCTKCTNLVSLFSKKIKIVATRSYF